MNKKGDVFQILIVWILLIVIAIAGFLLLVMSYRVNEFWATNTALMPENSTAAQVNASLQQSGYRTTDYAIFFFFLGLNIGVIIAATRTNFSAILIFMFILLVFIEIMVAAGFVNMYQGLAHEESVADIGQKLTLTNFIFSKYTPLLLSGIALIVIVIMFGKSGGDIVQ